MAALHLDNDIPIALASYLTEQGHTVVTALALGMTAAPDEQHLLAAANAGRMLVSHNWKDYRLLHAAWLTWSRAWGITQDHAGILVPAQASLQLLGPAIGSFLAEDHPLTNRLWRWTSTAGWVDHSE